MASIVSSSVPGRVDLELYEGDTQPRTVTIQTEAGAPIDVSSSSFKAEIRKHKNHATAYPITVDTTDAATGVLIITPPTGESLPNPAVWDLRQYAGSVIVTLLEGRTFMKHRVTEIP